MKLKTESKFKALADRDAALKIQRGATKDERQAVAERVAEALCPTPEPEFLSPKFAAMNKRWAESLYRDMSKPTFFKGYEVEHFDNRALARELAAKRIAGMLDEAYYKQLTMTDEQRAVEAVSNALCPPEPPQSKDDRFNAMQYTMCWTMSVARPENFGTMNVCV